MYSLSTTVDPGYIDLGGRARAFHAGLLGPSPPSGCSVCGVGGRSETVDKAVHPEFGENRHENFVPFVASPACVFAALFAARPGRCYLERPIGRLVGGDQLERRGRADFYDLAEIYYGGATVTITQTGAVAVRLPFLL